MRERRVTWHGAALALAVALTLVGCDSSDDDGEGGGDGEPDPGPGDETATASTFADVIALGANDDPIALDAEALGADLDNRFGTTSDEPTEIGDEDTIDTLAKTTDRRGSTSR